MYLRLVRLKLREGAFWAFRTYYEERILPTLDRTEGCLYAALLRRAEEPVTASCDSLTIWESAAHAEAYVSKGIYDVLLDGADPFLAEATEWKAELQRADSTPRPPLPDPAVETYPVEVARVGPTEGASPSLFLKIVDHRVEPKHFEELKRTWQESVAPGLLEIRGCRAAYLLEGLRGRSQALSVTFWDDESSAVRYETSGRFDALVSRVRPYLSGLYQWRLSLAPAGTERDLRGTDLSVSGFHIVAGRRLGSPAP